MEFSNRPISQAERRTIRAYYESAPRGRGEFNLDALAQHLGRSKHLVSRAACQMGLTDPNRPVSEELRASTGGRIAETMAERGHPRGMAGKSHDEDTRKKISAAQVRINSGKTAEDWERRAEKARETRERNGKVRVVTESTYSRCRRGRREDLGDTFFRSSWEANYARYLNWRVANPRDPLRSWTYEPTTFWFSGIKRGVVSYTPDFLLEEDGVDPYYVELKGWMDDKSKTKLARMAKYHPNVRLDLVDAKAYRALEKAVARLIPHWE